MLCRNKTKASPRAGGLAVAGLGLLACGADAGGPDPSSLDPGGMPRETTVAGRGVPGYRGPYVQYWWPATRLNLVGLNGTYGPGCRLHANQPWHIPYYDYRGLPPEGPPEVSQRDRVDGCTLTLSGLRAVGGIGGAPLDIPLETPIPLSRTLLAHAAHSKNYDFWVNARLGDLDTPPTAEQANTFYGDFLVHVVYSNYVDTCEPGSPPGVSASYRVKPEGSSVPIPNYVTSWKDLSLKFDDKNNILATSTGWVSVELAASAPQPGDAWKLMEKIPSEGTYDYTSFSYIDRWYGTQPTLASGVIMGSSPITIPWDTFALSGVRASPAHRFLFI